MLVDELHVLPGAVEQDTREAEIRDPEQVLPPDASGKTGTHAPFRRFSGKLADIRARRDLERDLLQLVDQPLLASGSGDEIVGQVTGAHVGIRGEL